MLNKRCIDGGLKKVRYFKRNSSIAVNLQPCLSRQYVRPQTKIFTKFAKDLAENDLCKHFPQFKIKLFGMVDYPSKMEEKHSPNRPVWAYKVIEKAECIGEDSNFNLVCLLEWFIDMLQDIVSNNSKKNYFKDPEHTADNQYVNEMIFLENSVIFLLRKYYKSHPNYTNVINLVQNTLRKSYLGENLEFITHGDIESFDMDLFKRIAEYKVAQSYFIFPTFSAIYSANQHESINLKNVEQILTDLGIYKKIEMDYMEIFGKHVKNIHFYNKKCSWVILKSLEKCDITQMKHFKKNFEKIDSVEELIPFYKEFKLNSDFSDLKKETYEGLKEKIDEIQHEQMNNYLTTILNHIFRIKLYN